MLKKPANYDTVQTFGEWQPLELGGHYLTILGVKVDKSKSGRDMLVVQYDTAKNDKQPNYYQDNHEQGRYYQGTHYIVLGDEDWAVRNIKSLITATERSNPGFQFDWSNPNCLRGKLVGGVFGAEQYLNDRQEVKDSVKLRYFCSNDSVESASVPKPKEIAQPKWQAPAATASSGDDFAAPSNDTYLPFDL